MKTHQQVIENFVVAGRSGRGTYVVADEKDHALYSNYHRRWESGDHRIPLLVRLADQNFLANGAFLTWPRTQHQTLTLKTLENTKSGFGVVPFDSITAAWTQGAVRNWNRAPFKLKDLRKEVEIVVPSAGEQWREVTVKDKYGREQKSTVHTLGDSVIRVRDHFYVSAVDETGYGRGTYFLAQLTTDRPPISLEEALTCLKPKVVQEAEAAGISVRRQGEWFAIPIKMTTTQLLRDVERGVAVWRKDHVLGRDGHHQLEEAVIYRFGPQKGEVYARGVLTHTRHEHADLDLGFRWHRIVHNITPASYSLGGNFD
jgi:hypothetical protein